MAYKEKYLKYKEKYLKLRKQIGGNNLNGDICVLNDVFDLDCFLPLTTNRDKDFIFTRRLSKETINFIRTKIQQYYPYFYNFMAFPNLSNEDLKNKDLIEEIMIPIINRNVDNLEVGKVDYELIANKLHSNKILDIIELIKKEQEQQIELNDNTDEYIDFLKNKKKEYPLLFTNITDDQIESCNKLKNIYLNTDDLQNILLNNVNSPKSNSYSANIIDNFWNEYLKKLNKLHTSRSNLIETINLKQTYPNYDSLINYDENIELDKDPIIKIRRLFENKKNQITKNILQKFKENPSLNCQVIKVSLKWYDDNPKSIISQEIGHANSVTVYRFKKNGEDHYLCLRSEPHRHTNIYCRNSVRKAIRNIFSKMPNSHYLDYIINSREGLQINEENEIDKENLKDFDNLPNDIKNLSPLQGNSGFCASWTIYINLILLLNRDVPLERLGEYFATFDHKFDTVSKSKKFLEEFKKCYETGTQNLTCRKKEDFVKDVKEYTSFNPDRSFTIPNEDPTQSTLKYILVKQIKLYRTIIFILYYITRKFKETSVFDNIKNSNDKQILKEIFDDFDKNTKDVIKERLLKQSNIQINISDNILQKDTHLCDDNLFLHKDFCLTQDVTKPIPNPDKWKCNQSNLKSGNNIVLKGLISSQNEQKLKKENIVKTTQERLVEILQNII
jgi:hypothetical protein